MKKYSVLFAVAVFLFSCHSEIESPDSILQRLSNASTTSSSSEAVAYQVLTNLDFSGGVLAPWEKSFGSLLGTDQGTIKTVDNSPYGYDALFTPSKKEKEDWDLQLIQRNLDIKPGYSYKFVFGGNAPKGGTAPVAFVLMNCKTESNCEDYKKWTVSLSLNYVDFENLEIWKNCSETNPKATFVISGGKSTVEFKIAWISIWAEPVSCP